MNVVKKSAPYGIKGENRRIPDNDKQGLGARDRNVEAARIGNEAE